MFETADWSQFLDIATLPQKAGCEPDDLPRAVIKELGDNALDNSAATVTIERDASDEAVAYTVCDNGPGLDPSQVVNLFSVKRALTSSKLIRRPLRGMLGNGLRVVTGAVAATHGHLVVTTRGHCLTLAVDPSTGCTSVIRDKAVRLVPGMKVRIALGGASPFTGDEHDFVRTIIALASVGRIYSGASSPHWYSVEDIHHLFLKAPGPATVADVVRAMGLDPRGLRGADLPARTLGREDAERVHMRLQAEHVPIEPVELGYIGQVFDMPGYAREADFATIGGARIPYVVEAWASCERVKHGEGYAGVDLLLLNRTVTLSRIWADLRPQGIVLEGCSLHRTIHGMKGSADYKITLSLITPHIRLSTDGKEPVLAPFGDAIAAAVGKAARAAHRAMAPSGKGRIKEAAWEIMPTAYREVSGPENLPANARQIMYKARPYILRVTGEERLNDKTFTQHYVPDFVAEHPQECADWDVVYDARGHITEPHTRVTVPLGTIEVREYLKARPKTNGSLVEVASAVYPTHGPEDRYSNILFIEKEGFDALLTRAQIAERFDIAIMSTKGMSVVAARKLIDDLARRTGDGKVFVLHDFDVSGFSIFGTLGTDGRRYSFENAVEIIDLGLRLADIRRMRLEAEPVGPWRNASGQSTWPAKAATLARHRATREEIDVLEHHRVELNAMTSMQFIDFLVLKLTQHGVRKVIPVAGTIERHARRVVELRMVEAHLAKVLPKIKAQAAKASLPNGLVKRVRARLGRDQTLSWDQAVTKIIHT
jgi:hypothetical protein